MINKHLNRLSRALEILTAILFIFLIIIILIKIFGRFLGISGTGWTDEIISCFTTWMVFMGISYLTERGEHISVSLLEDSLGGIKKDFLKVIIRFINILCGFGVIFSGYFWSLSTIGKRTPYLQIYYNLWYVAVFIFGIFFTLFSIFKLIDFLKTLFNN